MINYTQSKQVGTHLSNRIILDKTLVKVRDS